MRTAWAKRCHYMAQRDEIHRAAKNLPKRRCVLRSNWRTLDWCDWFLCAMARQAGGEVADDESDFHRIEAKGFSRNGCLFCGRALTDFVPTKDQNFNLKTSLNALSGPSLLLAKDNDFSETSLLNSGELSCCRWRFISSGVLALKIGESSAQRSASTARLSFAINGLPSHSA